MRRSVTHDVISREKKKDNSCANGENIEIGITAIAPISLGKRALLYLILIILKEYKVVNKSASIPARLPCPEVIRRARVSRRVHKRHAAKRQ